MKILFINSVFGIGSTGRIISDLAAGAENQGYECRVACGIKAVSGKDADKAVGVCTKTEYYVTNLLSKLTGLTGYFAVFSTNKLIKIIDSEKPDLIHIHNLHGYYVNVYRLVSEIKKRGIPLVWTLHDCWAFTGNCSNYSYHGCDRYMKECGGCACQSEYPKSWIFDTTKHLLKKKKVCFKGFDRLILTTPSKWLKGEVEKSFLRDYRCIAIHNGMDVDKFNITESGFKREHGIEDKRIVLGVANVWNRKKGFEDFLKLSKKLPEEYIIVLVGLTDKQIETLPGNVIGIKRTKSIDDLVKVYNAADVFVNPSYEETFGMVTAEALLCGVPVITYDKTAVPEIVSNDSGVTVNAGDVDALAREITALKEYDREAVRKTALVYSRENMVESYLKVYKDLLGGFPGEI